MVVAARSGNHSGVTMYRLTLAVLLAILLIAAPAWAADFTITPICCTTWTINGQANPPLNLVRGRTYTFAVNASGHPFFIKTAQVTGNGSTWDEGVTNNGVETGTLTFMVPADAPATLFYQCGVHSAMTGSIAIISPVPATGPLATAFLALILGGMGLVAMRRGLRLVRLT
jgi:hypothetical protein